jgi:hypothetical protein
MYDLECDRRLIWYLLPQEKCDVTATNHVQDARPQAGIAPTSKPMGSQGPKDLAVPQRLPLGDYRSTAKAMAVVMSTGVPVRQASILGARLPLSLPTWTLCSL